ncbi:MAG: c-type cytochrome [Thermodesulfovibrionales bacterium]|nr:c-type cytochrome [Thermodesulfovibrionales bacterium]
MRLNKRQRLWLFLLFIALFAVAVIAVRIEFTHPWQWYQREFKALELKAAEVKLNKLQAERSGAKDPKKIKGIDEDIERLKISISNIKSSSEKIEQIWLVELKEADRCLTCHQGVEKTGFEDKPHPFKSHPGDYLKNHPVNKFGCVVCHDGQGAALTVKDAHGEVEHWLRPLLRGSLAQASCGKCHFADQKLPLDTVVAGSEQFMKGWKLYMDNNCLGCHKLMGYERPKRIGPVLTPISKKVNHAWLTEWIKDPKGYLPKTKMPNFMLKDDEISLIASYILSLSTEKIAEPKSRERLNKPEAIKSGESLVNKLGCLSCHTINKRGGTFGPDLSGIAAKATPEWLVHWLKNPKVYQSDTPMPNLRIPEREIQDIVAYLNTFKKQTGKGIAVSTNPANIEKGRKLVKDKGCTGCHEIEKFPLGFNAPEHDGIGSKRTDELAWGDVKADDKTLQKWLQIKVMEPRKFATKKIIAKMPNFGFKEDDAKALVTFLMSLRKEPLPQNYAKRLNDATTMQMRGRKFLEEKNCLGCHKINKKGGEVGPDLTQEGKKVRPEWLFAFLKSPSRIRPMQEARMPDFKLPDAEINTIIEYLSFVAKEPYPYNFSQKKNTFVENIKKGEKLYQKELACLGCHLFEGKGGMVGPEHTDMASRLKREWVEKWLDNPQAIQPDVIMPRFKFKGKDKEMLLDYLMTMGKERFLIVE